MTMKNLMLNKVYIDILPYNIHIHLNKHINVYKTYKHNVCAHVKVRNIINHKYKFYIFTYLII